MRARAAEAAVPYVVQSDEELLSRLERLIGILGSNRVAWLLGVSKSQPSRWRAGKEGISPPNRVRLWELDHFISRLLDLMHPAAAEIWLDGFNGFLNTRPIDAFRLTGLAGVQLALDGEEEGAYV
jgi:hypothetical protein